jgi:hypothetical protein
MANIAECSVEWTSFFAIMEKGAKFNLSSGGKDFRHYMAEDMDVTILGCLASGG